MGYFEDSQFYNQQDQSIDFEFEETPEAIEKSDRQEKEIKRLPNHVTFEK